VGSVGLVALAVVLPAAVLVPIAVLVLPAGDVAEVADVADVFASSPSCVSIACRSAEKDCMKLDTLLAATVPVLVMLLLVGLAAEMVPTFELAEACATWFCHQLVDPLMLPMDMAAVSKDVATVVHRACHLGRRCSARHAASGWLGAGQNLPG
jgi:hypothetical protein